MNAADALAMARHHLALLENEFWSESGGFYADEGLFLLEELGEAQPAARQLAATYVGKLLDMVQTRLIGDVPEPDLKEMLKLIQTLEDSGFGEPDRCETVRIMVAERLLDRYFEGYSGDERERAIRAIVEIN